MALFLQHFLCSLPRLPRPTAVNTPQAHEEQLLFPGRVQKWAPRSASLAGPESQPGGWGRELGGEFGHRGRQEQAQALSPPPCVEDSCPGGSLALEGSHTGSLDRGKLPSSQRFSL